MADIFISYSKQEPELTTALVKDLEACGYTSWWDTRILSGDEFPDIIHQELNLARAVIVIWTPNSVQSRWVRAEAHIAAEQGKLIPLRSYDLTPAQLPFPHNTLHADLFDDRPKIFQALDRLGVLPPGGIAALSQYQEILAKDAATIENNKNNFESKLKAELQALRLDMSDIIESTENIINNIYSNSKTSPRFDIHQINERYEIFANGDTNAEVLFQIYCAKDTAHFWRYWITTDREAPEVQILRTLNFQAEDRDTGRKLYTLPVINESRRKVFSIFFPELHSGERKNIYLSYSWPGYMNQLFETGATNFDWQYASQNPNTETKIYKEWIFYGVPDRINCTPNEHVAKTGAIEFTSTPTLQKWVYSSEKAKTDPNLSYVVRFSLN